MGTNRGSKAATDNTILTRSRAIHMNRLEVMEIPNHTANMSLREVIRIRSHTANTNPREVMGIRNHPVHMNRREAMGKCNHTVRGQNRNKQIAVTTQGTRSRVPADTVGYALPSRLIKGL